MFEKKKEAFRFFGLGKQEVIKYFFGGNASLAFFILVLIGAFLLREAWYFFPKHHQQLKTFRETGIEYFVMLDDAYEHYKVGAEALNRAHDAELRWSNRGRRLLLTAYSASRIAAEKDLGHPLLVLKDALKQRKEIADPNSPKAIRLEAVIETLIEEIEAKRDEIALKLTPRRVRELGQLDSAARKKVVAAVSGLRFWQENEADYYVAVKGDLDEAVESASEKSEPLFLLYRTYRFSLTRSLESLWKECSLHARTTRDHAATNAAIPRQIETQVNAGLLEGDRRAVRAERLGAALEVIAGAEYFEDFARVFYLERISNFIKSLRPDEAAYQLVSSATRSKVEEILGGVEGNFADFLKVIRTEKTELDAVLKSIPQDAMEPEQRKLLFELNKLDPLSSATIRRLSEASGQFVAGFPYDRKAERFKNFTRQFDETVEEMKTKGRAEFAKFPAPGALQTETARYELTEYRRKFEADIALLEETGKVLSEWRHNRPWTWGETAASFFLGKRWTGDSEIQERYGILPMLAGSVIISLIALCVAVPISVAAAVYVNQFASFKEQSILKPAIQFIAAIPSVVLGFLGLVMVSQLVKNLSFWPIFSWLPGFPIEERLNMLTAGLLLAFMACPIIFSLVEEALSKAPKAHRDSSLSLGATRLQTAFRVIVPASLSGVLAAVLLGFGRVIGETMVVFLVAGNRIAIPDFSEGLGIVAEPASTLTGIIAQDLGGTAKDSVDYRALFMVGVVLFFLTLFINYIGQKILRKRHPLRPGEF